MNHVKFGSAQITALMAVLVAAGLGMTGCSEPPKVSSTGKPVTVKGMEVNVQGYSVLKPELTQEGKIFAYDKPVMAVKVSLRNKGKEAFIYTPDHSSGTSEARTPLLYYAPAGKKKKLPPKNKSVINGVTLEEGTYDPQLTGRTVIEPGQSVTDVYLFEVPGDEQAELVFSVPPTMHGGKKPVLFRMNYKRKEPQGQPTYKVGQAVERGGATFTVTSAEATYVKVKHRSEGEGYSSNPLFKVSYEIKNTGDAPLTYKPGHKAVAGRRVAELSEGQSSFSRMKFGGSTTVLDQINEEMTVEPGDAVEDFSIFNRPGKTVDTLTFTYPATRFGAEGLVRVRIPYEWEDPEKPEELKKDKKDEEDEE